jgi:hypothetical protein
MKYTIEHDFEFPANTVFSTMFDPSVIEKLKPRMPLILEAELLSCEEKGNMIKRRVRYLPEPFIKSVGPKKVEPKWMEWIEESEADIKKLTVNYRNIPTVKLIAEKMHNSGTMVFENTGSGRCRRVIKGELKIDVFILGAIAERMIFVYARKILDEEAKALSGCLK